MRPDLLTTLCAIAEDAASAVMAVYRLGGQQWVKGDTSPLTEADLRADRVIRQGLEQCFPGIFILSEESVSSREGSANRFFLVDPLDGTKEFLKRNDEFTINIALIEDGQPTVGVVLAPARQELFYAARSFGAFKRDATGTKRIMVSRADPYKPLGIVGSRSHGNEQFDVWLKRLKRPYSCTAVGSSLKFCLIAEGRADVYPRFGPTSQWDTAAAQAVLEAAGGVVLDMNGLSLGYGLDRPLLNPPFMALADGALYNQLA